MHWPHTSSLISLPAAVMSRVSAATPTAARLWCGRLHCVHGKSQTQKMAAEQSAQLA